MSECVWYPGWGTMSQDPVVLKNGDMQGSHTHIRCYQNQDTHKTRGLYTQYLGFKGRRKWHLGSPGKDTSN